MPNIQGDDVGGFVGQENLSEATSRSPNIEDPKPLNRNVPLLQRSL